MPFPPRPAGARRFAALALAVASLVAAAAVGSVFLTTARDSFAAIAAAGPASPADAILLVAAVAGAVLSLWLGLGLALSALSALPGALGQASTALAARIAPAAVRNVVALVLGTALTAALVPGATPPRSGQQVPRTATVASAPLDAAPDASFRSLRHTNVNLRTADGAPDPSWAPERRPRTIGGPVGGPGVAEIVVHRGDTLWSIAAGRLGPAAATADIDSEWHRWFAANRDVIGRDPNVIVPGQRLNPPERRLNPPKQRLSTPEQRLSTRTAPAASARDSS